MLDQLDSSFISDTYQLSDHEQVSYLSWALFSPLE